MKNMLHKMTLDPSPFDMIACGKKDIELRLYDEKRRQLKTGDEIQFSCKERGRVLLTVVATINVYKDFRQLYKSEPLERCGYGVEQLNSASYTDMQRYYSEDKVQKYGVVAICLKDVKVKEISDDCIETDNQTG